jgi:hypothetical protein
MADDLTAGELIDALSGLDEDTPVRLAHQPAWPFEYGLRGAEVVDGVEDDDHPGEPYRVVYLVEGEQRRYLPGLVADQIGWGDR